jgi:hypothetical protein
MRNRSLTGMRAMTHTLLPQIDKARALEIGRSVIAGAYRITKSVLLLSALTVGLCVSWVVALMCYAAIIGSDAMWSRLATHFPGNLDLLVPSIARTVALILGAFGVVLGCDCAEAISQWKKSLRDWWGS